MSKKSLSAAALFVASAIWGMAFVFQQIGMDHIGPFTFGSLRFLLGAAAVLPVMLITQKKKKLSGVKDAPLRKYLTCGAIVGVVIFFASAAQQYGLVYTTSGRAGFVTALYMVLVPLFAWVFQRKKPSAAIGAAVLAAITGTFLLCASEGTAINIGDGMVFIGAIFWAVQILLLEKYSDLDGIKLAFVEYITCSALSAIPMLLVEKPTASGILAGIVPLLYCGVISVGIGFTAQVFSVKFMEPTVASLIMSLESVFSAVAGYFILGELLTTRQIAGCVLVFGAVAMTQLQGSPKHVKAVNNTEGC